MHAISHPIRTDSEVYGEWQHYQAVPSSAPDSDARAGAGDVARLVFAQLDPAIDVGIGWSGAGVPRMRYRGERRDHEDEERAQGMSTLPPPIVTSAVLIPDLFAM